MKKRYFYVSYNATTTNRTITNSIHFSCFGFFNLESLKKQIVEFDLPHNEEYKTFNIVFFYEFSADDYIQFTDKL
jgi:hypothetical protein